MTEITDEILSETIKRAFEIWITHEVRRRQEAGAIPRPLALIAAQ